MTIGRNALKGTAFFRGLTFSIQMSRVPARPQAVSWSWKDRLRWAAKNTKSSGLVCAPTDGCLR